MEQIMGALRDQNFKAEVDRNDFLILRPRGDKALDDAENLTTL